MRINNVNLVRQRGGWNLCGEACVAMLANYERGTALTAKQVEIKPRGMDTPQELVTMGARVGLSLTFRRNQYAGAIKGLLDSQRPVILLIQYEYLPERAKAPGHKDYKAGHYIVAFGYDATWIYFHDPLNASEVAISWGDLGKCWNVSGFPSTFVYSNRVPEQPAPEPIPPTGGLFDMPPQEAARELAHAALIANWLATKTTPKFYRHSDGTITAQGRKGDATAVWIPTMATFYALGGKDGNWEQTN